MSDIKQRAIETEYAFFEAALLEAKRDYDTQVHLIWALHNKTRHDLDLMDAAQLAAWREAQRQKGTVNG